MTLLGSQLNSPLLGAVAASSYSKPAADAFMTRKQVVGVLLPGLLSPCNPPPVQVVTASALSIRHVRVRFAPQSVAALAKSRNDDAACSPSEATFPDGLYCFMMSR